MGLFSRLNKNREKNEFVGDNQYISGGNAFVVSEQNKANLEKLSLTWNPPNKEQTEDTFSDDDVETILTNTTKKTTPYIFYQYFQLCNYFINKYKYSTSDNNMMRIIKKMQMIAFFNGKAGLWFNRVTQSYIPVAIVDITHNRYGMLKSVTVNSNFDFDMVKENQEDYKHNPNYNFTITDPNDIVIYQLKNNGLSCWIWLREYVNIQHQLMGQISACSLINNKIISFSIDNKKDNKKSLLSFLNPKRFWLYTRNTNKMSENIKVLSELVESDITIKYLDIYRQTMDIYSDYIGIRNNTEFKKERNTVDEVNAEQGWFDALEYEIYFNLKHFIDELNSRHMTFNKVELEEFR